MFVSVQPYPVRCRLGGGNRANSVQKQSHFQTRAQASHSSENWLRQNHKHANAVAHKTAPESPQLYLGPRRTERPLDAPPPLRAHFFKTRRNWWMLVPLADTQLLHKPFPQHRHSASVSWVWRGHLDPIHVRNVMGVQLRGS